MNYFFVSLKKRGVCFFKIFNFSDISSDHVGGPAPCCIVKLEDVPEYDMRAEDGIGQLLVKGPSITPGYYDEDHLTKKLFTKDGIPIFLDL